MIAACVYERKIEGRNWTPQPGVGRGKASRETWIAALTHHLTQGDITSNDVAVGVALSGFSNRELKQVWPSQATLGQAVNRSARTVRRSLNRLKKVGLLDWHHRFFAVRGGRPRATSNEYVFTLSGRYRELLDQRSKPKRRRNAKQSPSGDTGARRTTDVGQLLSDIPTEICAIVRVAATIDIALNDVAGLSVDGGPEFARAHTIAAWEMLRPECAVAISEPVAGVESNPQRE